MFFWGKNEPLFMGKLWLTCTDPAEIARKLPATKGCFWPEAAVHSRTVVGHEPPIKARQNQARESSLHTMWLETGS